MRQISSRFLSQDERIEIADLRHAGLSIRQIATKLGRAPSTISRELLRNGGSSRGYRPFEAHRRATARRARHHRRRIETNHELRKLIAELLAQRWSPQQISRHLRQRFPKEPAMWLCHESIYQAVHPEDRSEAGHWEGDLIIGKDQRSAIGTLVERTTRAVRLLHLPQRDGDSLHEALRLRMGGLPAGLLRSITWDQGTEMARHLIITESLDAPIYFCDSRSPWQRGSNENTNGLLRDYFPKGTDLSVHSPRHLLAVENELNNRPRQVLNGQSPAALFAALLASKPPSVLRR